MLEVAQMYADKTCKKNEVHLLNLNIEFNNKGKQ